MAPIRTLLLSGAALSLLMGSSGVSPGAYAAPFAGQRAGLIQVADAGDVAAAEKRVKQAEAALQKAQASGQGVDEAQQALSDAQAALAQAKAEAGTSNDNNPSGNDNKPGKNHKPPTTNDNTNNPPATTNDNSTPPDDNGKKGKHKKPATTDENTPAVQDNNPPPPPPPPPPTDNGKKPSFKKDNNPPSSNDNNNPPPPPPPTDNNPPPPPPPPPPGPDNNNPPKTPVLEDSNNPSNPAFDKGKKFHKPGQNDNNNDNNNPKTPGGKNPPPPPPGAEPPPPPMANTPVPMIDLTIDIGKGKKPPKSSDGRFIFKDSSGQIFIKHDEESRFRRPGDNVKTTTAADGTTISTVNTPDGSQITTITDADGNIIRRTRKLPNGKVIVLIDSKPQDSGRRKQTIDYFRRLPPVVLRIPQQQYVVESQQASPDQIYQTLEAPPVEMVERPYTLDEIRQSERLRDKVRRIDVDTITFETGQSDVPPDEINDLSAIGRAISAIIQRDPTQVYLIEGHTDAVGSDVSNLALSDRRAESVASILSTYYGVPPENLVTQGYGEQYLKVPTQGPERENRRVTVRNITPLLKADNGPQQ